MTLQTPTSRSAAINEMWNEEERFLSATQYLTDGTTNASSELVGAMFEIGDPRESEQAWIESTIDAVEIAGAQAASDAMVAKLAELIDSAPASLVDYPDSRRLRELRALDR